MDSRYHRRTQGTIERMIEMPGTTVTDALATVDQEVTHRLIEGLLLAEIERLTDENTALRQALADAQPPF